MDVTETITIAASPAEVYSTVMDPRRLGDWVTIHKELVEAPPGELDTGDELVQRLKVAGQGFTVRWRVTRDDRPEHIEWRGSGPLGTDARVTYTLEPEGDGTVFSYSNEFKLPGGAAGKLAGRAVRAAARRETKRTLDRLKALIEGDG